MEKCQSTFEKTYVMGKLGASMMSLCWFLEASLCPHSLLSRTGEHPSLTTPAMDLMESSLERQSRR